MQQLFANMGVGGFEGTNLSPLTAGIGAGSFSQPGGGLGGAIASPTQGGSEQRGFTIGAGSGNTSDPASIIAKLGGLGSGLLRTASPTASTGTPTDPEAQAAFAAQREGERIASPVAPSNYGIIGPDGLPLPGTQSQPTIGPDGIPTTGFGEGEQEGVGLYTGGGPGSGVDSVTTLGANTAGPSGFTGTPSPTATEPVTLNLVNQWAGGQIPPGLAQLGVNQDNLSSFLGAMGSLSPEASQRFLADLSMGGIPGFTPPASGSGEITGVGQQVLSPTPGTPPTNWAGVLAGGAGGAMGITNLLRALDAGSVPGGIGGGLQTIGGLSTLLRSSPELLSTLGLDPNAASKLLAGTGVTAGGLGSLLGLYGGIQGLQRGDELGGSLGIAGGALGGYNALQSLSKLYPQLFGGDALPQIGDAALKAIGSFAPETAAAIREGLGAVANSGSSVAGLAATDYANLVGLALAAASPFIKSDPSNAAIQKGASTALTLATMMLSQTGYGAAVAAAINSAMKIYEGIEKGQSGGEIAVQSLIAGTPIGMLDLGGGLSELISQAYGGDWARFPSRIADTGQKASSILSLLERAIPYAQTKEELGQIVNAYQNMLRTSTDWGGQGFAGTQPYQIGSLPQAAGSKHEGGARYDFGPRISQNQQLINLLRANLPGTEITAGYGEPGGSFASPADAMRLWTQFTNREQTAPHYLAQPGAPTMTSMIDENGNPVTLPGLTPGFYSQGALAQSGDLTGSVETAYGRAPGYDYVASGFPRPGEYVGQPSELYSLMRQGIPPAMIAQLMGAPQPSAPGSTGLMAMLSGLVPQTPGTNRAASPSLLQQLFGGASEDERNILAAAYGLA